MKRGRIDFIKFIRENVLLILMGAIGSSLLSMVSLYAGLRTGNYILPALFSASISVLLAYFVSYKKDAGFAVLMQSAIASSAIVSCVVATVIPEIIVEKASAEIKAPSYFLSPNIYGFENYFSGKKQYSDALKSEMSQSIEGMSLSEMAFPLCFILIAVLLLASVFCRYKREDYVRRKECDFPQALAASMIITGTGKKQTVSKKALIGAAIGSVITAIRVIISKIPSALGARFMSTERGFIVSPLATGLGYIAGFKRSAMMLIGAVFSYLAAIPFMMKMRIASDFQGAESIRFQIGIGLVIGAGIGTLLDMFVGRVEERERRRIDDEIELSRAPLKRSIKNTTILFAVFLVVYIALRIAGISSLLSLVCVVIGYISCHAAISIKGESGVTSITVSVAIAAMGVMTVGSIFEFEANQMFLALFFIAAASAMASALMDSYKIGMRLGISHENQFYMQMVGGAAGLASCVICFMIVMKSDITIVQSAMPVSELFAGGVNLFTLWLSAAISAALVLLKLPAASFAIGAFLPFSYSVCFFLGGLTRFINIRRKKKTDFNVAMGLGAGESIMLCVISIITWIFGV